VRTESADTAAGADAPAPLLLKGGRPYGEDVQDVLVRDGRIAALGTDLEAPEGTEVIDVEGCIVLPGLVDLHTHLREPGGEEAETVETGTRAAARGGFKVKKKETEKKRLKNQ
jgi:dihydroorotase